MSKKLCMLAVRGRQHEWTFPVYVDPRYLEEWREDGLDIHLLGYTIPVWVVEWRLGGLWCFLQDVFNFRNPFRR